MDRRPVASLCFFLCFLFIRRLENLNRTALSAQPTRTNCTLIALDPDQFMALVTNSCSQWGHERNRLQLMARALLIMCAQHYWVNSCLDRHHCYITVHLCTSYSQFHGGYVLLNGVSKLDKFRDVFTLEFRLLFIFMDASVKKTPRVFFF